MSDIAVWTFGAALIAHGLFGLYLGLGWRQGRQGAALLVAIAVSALWAFSGLWLALEMDSRSLWMTTLADWLRLLSWAVFLLILMQPLQRRLHGLLVGAVGILLVPPGVLLWMALQPEVGRLSWLAGGFLACSILGLVLVEQVYRSVPKDSRWGFKPLCVGLAALHIFDLYFFSNAVLFGRLDQDVWVVRAVVSAMVLPLIGLSAARVSSWSMRIQVSREVVFHSTALALSGLYLLLIAGAGYYVRYFGGEWGRVLQTALVSGGMLLLGVLFVSGSVRARLRVLISKNLFSYRYDYRSEWLRFTQALSSADDSLTLGQTVIKAFCDQVESAGGVLWLKDEQEVFRPHARYNHGPVEVDEYADSALCRFLDEREWVLNLEEWRSSPGCYDGLGVPGWLSEMDEAWLIIPLKSGGGLIGFVMLDRARTRFEVNWEVLDLLKTSQRQAASYLARMMATEALIEARKFDAFNRMSAFVVHDLKNLVAQLSLMLKNAQRHKDNPEFQADMLETVAHVEARMRQLMKQLQEKTSIEPLRPVDLDALLEEIVATHRHNLPCVRHERGDAGALEEGGRCLVAAHPDRLKRVIGHVVQNAFDATEESGKVCVRMEAIPDDPARVAVVVEDNGRGMSERFMREGLFRPFQSSKEGGMGIGVFEVQQYLREIGGVIRYTSVVGQGTTARMVLRRMHARGTATPSGRAEVDECLERLT
ncbi:MAG: XrtA/PEP-CTERM system histidine kinase PrsK [Rhodocyclaceae bacterium]